MQTRNYSPRLIIILTCFMWLSLSAQESILTAFDAEFADIFGYSVAIDGNYAIIGAPLQGGFGTQNAGAAYVYRLSGGSWIYMAKLTPPWGGDFGDQFGYSVDIAGNYAIVGAIQTDINGKSNAGAAYVFVTSGTQWYLEATLMASDADTDDHFGNSVGINEAGDVVVGAVNNDDHGLSTGAAYVFQYHYGNWIQTEKLLAGDGNAGDAFGTDVAIDGHRIVVGAPVNVGVDYLHSGAVYIFEPHYGHWTQTARLTHSIAGAFDHFGQSVDIEGADVIAGAPFVNDKAGEAYIFSFNGTSWVQTARLSSLDGSPHDKFGWGVGITDGYAVVGSYLDDDLGSESGSLYIYEQFGGSWSAMSERNASDAAPGDHLGTQVDIDGTYAIAGAPYHDAAAHDSGAAYIYGPSLSAAVPCPNSIVLSGTIAPGTYQVADFIQAEGVIMPSGTVVLSGTNYINLMPQLEVMQGGSLEINLAGCP